MSYRSCFICDGCGDVTASIYPLTILELPFPWIAQRTPTGWATYCSTTCLTKPGMLS